MSEPGNRMQKIRMGLLFAVLVLLLMGLWYDRKVARPGVEAAWDRIAVLNDEMNARASAQAMTNTDVQAALNRKPSSTVREGQYQVEVYSWMAGLPFRTHDYFAVYNSSSGKMLFKTHYKFELPLDELRPPVPREGTSPDAPDLSGREPGTTDPAVDADERAMRDQEEMTGKQVSREKKKSGRRKEASGEKSEGSAEAPPPLKASDDGASPDAAGGEKEAAVSDKPAAGEAAASAAPSETAPPAKPTDAPGDTSQPKP